MPLAGLILIKPVPAWHFLHTTVACLVLAHRGQLPGFGIAVPSLQDESLKGDQSLESFQEVLDFI